MAGESESLTDMMLAEHARIGEMLEDVNIATYEEGKNTSEAFNKFKWNLEKHFIMEEKAIFQMLNNISGMEVTDTFKLMGEHGSILSLMRRIEEDMKIKDYSKIQELMSQLEEHSDFENQTFYPNLDKKLSDDRKKEIVERVSEILRG